MVSLGWMWSIKWHVDFKCYGGSISLKTAYFVTFETIVNLCPSLPVCVNSDWFDLFSAVNYCFEEKDWEVCFSVCTTHRWWSGDSRAKLTRDSVSGACRLLLGIGVGFCLVVWYCFLMLGMVQKASLMLSMSSTTELQLQLQLLLGITDPSQDEASENEFLCCLLKPLLGTWKPLFPRDQVV